MPKYAKNQPAGFVNRIEKVAIVGAAGTLGGYFVRELLKTGKHTVTALTREASTSKLPAGVQAAPVNYDDHASLVRALRGQQFLIITMSVRAPKDTESKLVRAAAEAGVPYVMPNAYSPDPVNEKLMNEILFGRAFLATRREIEELGVSKWVTLGTGFWYEWSLLGEPDRFGVDLKNKTIKFYDDGNSKITTSTWGQCGRAVAALLSLRLYPDDENDAAPALDNWANKCVYISSFRVSQKDMFESIKRVTSTADADWTVSYVKSDERVKAALKALQHDRGDRPAFIRLMYTRVFYPTGEGDHSRLGLANEALGLPQEDIDAATSEGLRLLDEGKLAY
ncbi:putative oxidoreductase CipA [Auricularia subglabra TFB-10046 SS5]|uniref:Putative oxidoreductase CipA n=1 Tax=Auricularia subglabra (strain TFB-10046 / SS5) TaxID=717982 RepID=J0DBB1_AURST|nr:putative oxidoreductase CipA [Auricularia subglabra TFB-10046 SS5]